MTETTQSALQKTAGSIDGIKDDISRTLSDYDKKIGSVPENSLATLWERAWEVKDVNDLVNNNLRQIQVMIEDLYRAMLDERTAHAENIKQLRADLEDCKNSKEKKQQLRLLLGAESNYSESQIQQLKIINALVKTSRELANEIRQSAMARRFNIHISDVKKMAIAFRAVLHDRIQDVNLLCRISEDLDGVMKKIFPIKADGDY